MEFVDRTKETVRQMQTNGTCEGRKKTYKQMRTCFDLHTSFLDTFYISISIYTHTHHKLHLFFWKCLFEIDIVILLHR